MKIYFGKGNSSIITLHTKYLKDFKLYGKEFNHLIVHRLVEEIGSKYKNEDKLSGNTNRNKGLKKIIKHCYSNYNKTVITGTEIKALFSSYKTNNEKVLKCPWLLDTILQCIIELSKTLDKKTITEIVKKNSISCVNILTPNHKRILNANLKQIEKREKELGEKIIYDNLKSKIITLNESLENNFNTKCDLI